MSGRDIMSNEMCLKSVRLCLYLFEHVECKLSLRSHDKVSYSTTIFSQSKVNKLLHVGFRKNVFIRSRAPELILKEYRIQKYFWDQ